MRPYDPKKNSYWYESLAWLLREAPGLLGETSNMGGFISALESGGPGQTVASSDDHHEAILRRIGLWPDDDDRRAKVNIVARFRALNQRFASMSKQSQLVSLVYYEPRCGWPSGCAANLGEEFASVALAFADDRNALLDACSFAESAGSSDIIEAARAQARDLIKAAHEEWNETRSADGNRSFLERGK